MKSNITLFNANSTCLLKSPSGTTKNRICKKCYQDFKSPQQSANKLELTLNMSGSQIALSTSLLQQKDEGNQVPSAVCDECYSKALLSIERDRQQIDYQRRNIEMRLQSSFINAVDEDFLKQKKMGEEFVVGLNGHFYKKTSSDKNYDPQYNKVQEMGDCIKSFNIASNKDFQQKIQQQNLKNFNQTKRTTKPGYGGGTFGFRQNRVLSPSSIKTQINMSEGYQLSNFKSGVTSPARNSDQIYSQLSQIKNESKNAEQKLFQIINERRVRESKASQERKEQKQASNTDPLTYKRPRSDSQSFSPSARNFEKMPQTATSIYPPQATSIIDSIKPVQNQANQIFNYKPTFSNIQTQQSNNDIITHNQTQQTLSKNPSQASYASSKHGSHNQSTFKNIHIQNLTKHNQSNLSHSSKLKVASESRKTKNDFNKYYDKSYIEEEVGQDYIDLESDEELHGENINVDEDESNVDDEGEEIKLRINAKSNMNSKHNQYQSVKDHVQNKMKAILDQSLNNLLLQAKNNDTIYGSMITNDTFAKPTIRSKHQNYFES
ncbi:UNKNOWN [Stylonychia lemnae]|uniref:Uncharacterized protein n=1 Tax=Stylonychia lemnae TaxID=5949 RepID=A0A078A2G5_STYLE|nr:UNKNOWN [Stylonychia lemnae]|eukprot:CDW76315.1 UNKNOWN [Stylonychia lemnae]